MKSKYNLFVHNSVLFLNYLSSLYVLVTFKIQDYKRQDDKVSFEVVCQVARKNLSQVADVRERESKYLY